MCAGIFVCRPLCVLGALVVKDNRRCGLAAWREIFGVGHLRSLRLLRGEYIVRFGAGFGAGIFRKCDDHPPFSGVEKHGRRCQGTFSGAEIPA